MKRIGHAATMAVRSGPRPAPGARSRRGMSFVELLVAVALLAILVPVIGHALQVGRDLESRAARDFAALTAAENRWALLRIGELPAVPVRDEALPAPFDAYRWSLTLSPWEIETAQLAVVTVSYDWRGARRELALSGLLVSEAAP